MNDELRQLHEVLLDLVGLFNQPQRDAALIKEAGLSLDRALFPLLVRVEKRGPLGIVELAGLVGRDYTTVSRQVAKLEGLGLVTRRAGLRDRRVSDVAITKEGAAMNLAIDGARERLMWPLLSQWSEEDRQDLTRLLRRLVDDAQHGVDRPPEC
jgi:DNA-binding MarR family transcriptional regulator